MKALVACPKRLIWLDVETARWETAEDSRPEYYGISWNDELCLSHSNIDNAELGSEESYRNSIKGTISAGDRTSKPFLSQPHQIVCWEEKVICTNTGRNAIAIVDKTMSFENAWVNPIKWDRLGDGKTGNHFNSVYVRAGKLYVCAHNWEKPSRIFVINPITKVVEEHFDMTGSVWAHNVCFLDDKLLSCATNRGELVDVKTGDVLWRSKERILTRGLAITNDVVLVGTSVWDGSRKARHASDGGIWVLDRKTFKELSFVELKDSGCVNEIRITTERDYAHFGDEWIDFPGE